MASSLALLSGEPPGDALSPLDGVSEEQALAVARLIDEIEALERMKSAASAAQARLAAALDALERHRQAARGVPEEKQGAGVAALVARARRQSPYRGRVFLGLAKVLVKEMPHTLARLSAGDMNEWRAVLLARETACLSVDDRRRVDDELCSDPSRLEGVGDRRLVAAAKQVAYALDPHSVVARARKATNERTVACRPAPDTMAYLTALLPVGRAVAVLAALTAQTDRLRAAGDPRSRGQIMADTLVERVTGSAPADAFKVEVQLVMTDRTLFQGDAEPAHLHGYGTVPAQWARDLVRIPDTAGGGSIQAGATGHTDQLREVWLRRLYTAPGTGELLSMDSKARTFPDGMRRFIAARDQSCRGDWCDAPIRHHDHVVAFASGGPTSTDNGSGLCESCNYDKESAGWQSRVVPGERHTIETTTSAGRTHRTAAPRLPGAGTPTDVAPVDVAPGDVAPGDVARQSDARNFIGTGTGTGMGKGLSVRNWTGSDVRRDVRHSLVERPTSRGQLGTLQLVMAGDLPLEITCGPHAA